jgi:hypothetical protein
MIQLNITAEGFSEERFVADIIRPHLLNFGIYTHVRKVLTNRKLRKRGGIVGYGKFKNDVTQWFKECPDAYHTTLIDLYGLSIDFPGHATTQHLQPYSRVAAMEQQLKDDLQFYKFIPFIQLHEFEAMLFSDPAKMQQWLSLYNSLPQNCFEKILHSAPGANPELINENPETAPSKRILALCDDGYDKVDDGLLILKEIGLKNIRAACKHFDEWLITLEKLTMI